MYEHAHQTYEDMKRNLLAHVRGLFPVSGRVHVLDLKDIEIQDTLDPGDYGAQKQSRMTGRTWSVPVHARFELKDQSGKVIDRARMKIIDVPRLTNRGSYIVGGSEYMFPTQKRLRSGPYVRTGQNDELRTFFNMAKGRNFHLGLHPTRGHFQFQVDTSKNLPLYPLLRVLGVTDDQMVRAWGREAFVQNRVDDPAVRTKALKSIYQKMSYGADPPEDLEGGLREVFASTQMDDSNVELTLGKRLGKAEGQALLLASAKMLRVGRGEEKEDNRDSLIHNDIVNLGDFIVERFKDPQFRGRIQRTIRFNIDRRDKISQIISRDAFQRPVNSLFTESQLSQSPTQTNPLGMISDYTAVTVRGEGGIQQDNALTRGVRALDPSHLGFLDPAHTPEGQGVGTTLHLTTNTQKRGRDLTTKVLDLRTGREVRLTPVDIWKSTVAFSEAVENKRLKPGLKKIKALRAGEVVMVAPRAVHHAFMAPEHMLDVNTTNIPFVSHNNGARVMLASKLSVQAKPLADADAPLVQSRVTGKNDTVERSVGESFSPKSPVAGTVDKITDNSVVVSGHRVSLPNYFPLNNNNFVHARPRVKVGQKVKKGQVLADTNYSRDGQLAMGKNLLVAYMPYKGMNVEDGVVVSRQAAAKMTSEHLYQQPYAFDAETVIDLKRFRSYFPAKITEDQAAKLDERGVVKKGQTIEPGDILVASMRHQPLGTESQRMVRISKILAREYRDDSLVWKKDVPGIVQDVAWRPSEVIIHVRTKEPMRIGDKIAGRHANKSIVSHIVDDEDMPKDARGRTIDVVMNPNGVISRMNLGQILETTASRVAEKTGKPYMAQGFGGNSAEALAKELKAHGLKDHEDVYDPVENQKIPGILVGRQHVYKLEHQVTKKISARGGGPDEDYTSEEQPVRGASGGRAIGNMELYALLAHGALANVHEMYGVKSSFDPEVWRAIEEGAPLPPPKPAYAQERFTAMLKGMGIQTHHEPDAVSVVPFLDKQMKELSNGEITNHKLLRGKDLREEKNGLFDTKKTGGVRGDRWTHIKLPEPIPNPTFEKAILSLLHMKKDELDAIMADKGGKEIRRRLDNINVARRLSEAQKAIVGKSGAELNALHKEIRFLRVLKDRGIKPGEYVIDNLPVLPPKFRPVYTLPDGSLNVSDVNFHYQSTLQLAEQMKEMKGREFKEQRQKLVPQLYKSVGGVMGLNDGVVERATPPRGLARVISGVGSPKGGYLHSRLLKKRQDVSATNVIVPNPKLGLDEIGLPEATAWKTFRPFLIRELRIMGMTPLQARKAVDDKTPQARKALEKVVSERHVIINRAPTLHKFSVMALKPKLIGGHALEVPPLIVGGFNADFDGDQMGLHVPISAEANAEAAKMLPSRHLYKPGSKKLQQKIEHEYVLGLFKISRPGPVSAKRYQSTGQVLSELRARKIAPNAAISVTGIGATTPGRILINESLPTKLRDYRQIWTDKTIQEKLVQVDKTAGRDAFVRTLQEWSHVGRRYAYTTGSSFLLSDLQTMTKQRNQAFRRADVMADRIRLGSGKEEDKRQRIVKLYMDISGGLQKRLDLGRNDAGQSNNIRDMMEAGARGNPGQVRQMVSNIGVMLDHENRPMPEPVRGTYTEGLDSAEFFQHMYGNRKGMIDRSQSVRDPGALTKQVIVSAAGYRVSGADCGTTNGIMAATAGDEALDRYLAEAVAGVGGLGTVVTTSVLAAARSKNLKQIRVRSPLTCKAPVGVCARCYGLDEEGKLPPIGDHVGIKDSQGLTEPSTQLAMKTFHCNHAKSLVFLRRTDDPGRVLTMSMSHFFGSLASEINETDGEQVRKVTKWQVFDDGHWVDVREARRHEPTAPMVGVVGDGIFTVCQDNHPIAVWQNAVRCRECGYHRLKKSSPASRCKRFFCPECGHYQDPPETKIGEYGFLQPKDIEPKRFYIRYSQPKDFGPETEPVDEDGYFIGALIAEGYVSFRKSSPGANEKKPYTVSISQEPGRIFDKIAEAALLKYRENEKGLFFDSLEFGEHVIRHYGRYSRNFCLPPEFMSYPTPWLSDFLAGIVDGDGTVGHCENGPDKITIDTTSYELAQQIQLICTRLGIVAKVNKTTIRKLTRHQGFCVRLKTTPHACELLARSHKVSTRIEKMADDDVAEKSRMALVSSIKHVMYTNDHVYDLTTTSGTLTVSGVCHHNTGGVATSKKDLTTGFDRVKQLFTMPESMRSKATLAELGGRVDAIHDLPQGGTRVTIAGRLHKVARGRKVTVKVGDQVEKGQKISDGDIQPQDMLRLKGLRALQTQLRDDVREVYSAGGENISAKTVEVPVRMLTETVRIFDPGDHASLVAGDYSTYGRVDAWNRENVGKAPVGYTHQLPGSEYLPHRSDDWAKRMAHNRIQQVLTEAPAMGSKSRLQGDSPFAALVYGQRIKRDPWGPGGLTSG